MNGSILLGFSFSLEGQRRLRILYFLPTVFLTFFLFFLNVAFPSASMVCQQQLELQFWRFTLGWQGNITYLSWLQFWCRAQPCVTNRTFRLRSCVWGWIALTIATYIYAATRSCVTTESESPVSHPWRHIYMVEFPTIPRSCVPSCIQSI